MAEVQDVPTMPGWGWLALGGWLVMLATRQLTGRREAGATNVA